MNAFELLDFNEAKEQVTSGKVSTALPKLFKLAAAYPLNREIQAAVRDALNANLPAVKPAATTPSVPIAAAAPVTTKSPLKAKAWYGLPVIGTIVTLVGAFLPWITVSQAGTAGTTEANFNSLGGSISADTLQTGLLEKVTAIVLGNLHGSILLAVLGVLIAATLIGLFTSGKSAALVMLLSSAGGLGLLGWSYAEIKSAIDMVSTLSTNSGGTLAAQPGPGFWGSVLGIVINLVGTIVVIARINPVGKIKQGLEDLTA